MGIILSFTVNIILLYDYVYVYVYAWHDAKYVL